MFFSACANVPLKLISVEIALLAGPETFLLNIKDEDAGYGVHIQITREEARKLLEVLAQALALEDPPDGAMTLWTSMPREAEDEAEDTGGGDGDEPHF